MDKLTDLPPKETQSTPQETDVMKKYFGESSGDAHENGPKPSWTMTFKLTLYAAVLFLALCNPITDSIFCRLPWCGEGVITLLAAKTLIFMLLFIAMYRFML